MAANLTLILVIADQPVLLQQLLGKARQVADQFGWQVAVVPIGMGDLPDTAGLGSAGADIAYHFQGGLPLADDPETATNALSALIRQAQPRLVLIGATRLGMEIAPRIAERNQAGYAAWVNEFELDPPGASLTATCMLYAGMGNAVHRIGSASAVLSVAAGVFESQPPTGKAARLALVTLTAFSPRLKITGYRPKQTGSVRLEEAKMILDVGQGVKERPDLDMLQSVADLFGGQLSCSRPLASDRDWFPDWVGLSGKKVKPVLCLTVGTSGAIQHVVGIRDARVIVAVNTDENAGIFLQADYGVVADLYAFLPALQERQAARGIMPAWKA